MIDNLTNPATLEALISTNLLHPKCFSAHADDNLILQKLENECDGKKKNCEKKSSCVPDPVR